MVDRIESLEPGRSARASKLTTRSDDGYCGHWVGRAVSTGYPWTLALESAFQLAAMLVTPEAPEGARVFLMRIDRAEFAAPLPFGERLDYDLVLVRMNAQMARLECRIGIAGREVGRIGFAMGIAQSDASPLFTAGFAAYADYLTDGWRRQRAIAEPADTA